MGYCIMVNVFSSKSHSEFTLIFYSVEKMEPLDNREYNIITAGNQQLHFHNAFSSLSMGLFLTC